MALFDDAELERYYRRIEARTGSDRTERTERAALTERTDRAAVEDPRVEQADAVCPTPDKSGHATAREAWLAVSVLRAGRLRRPTLDVYRCRCGLWHITSRDTN
ncbi:hypothetical protein [Gordonia crocea]|uniref:Uncharacterized protein n=1 Tax=Gordonia crocea TaxID=589162 RepID=A0A7I9UYG6_9ACTN|nr:hypothetical protein [Gordonia crocea]GED97972.1 hypothetical protein nbrc107697_20110 [Gordonia crocea]